MKKKIFTVFISIFLSLNFVLAQTNSVDTYQNVSSGLDGSSTTTEISNTSTAGLRDTAQYVGTMAAAAILTLIIFKFIEGAVLKGTYDNIFDQQKGNKIIKNAATTLLIFIFVNLLFTYIDPDYGSWIFGVSTGVAPSKTIKISGSCDNDPKYISASFLDQIKQDEEDGKFANRVYLDSVGLPTIGWGFNLDLQNEPQKYLTQVGITGDKASKLINCKKDDRSTGSCGEITKDQADKLLQIELDAHLPAVYAFAGGQDAFNKLPTNLQNVIKNISYAGDGTLNGFVNLKKDLPTQNLDAIAGDIINSKWCTQTKSRCSRVVGLVYNGKCPVNPITNSPSIYGNNQDRCLKPLAQTDMEQIGTISAGDCVPAGPIYLRTDVAEKFKQMQQAAQKDGVTLTPTTGYRSDSVQVCLWNKYGQDPSKVAKPCSLQGGGSNHVSGTAVDISMGCTTGNTASQCNQKIYNWLKNNAANYGFYNKLNKDPVHWSLSGS